MNPEGNLESLFPGLGSQTSNSTGTHSSDDFGFSGGSSDSVGIDSLMPPNPGPTHDHNHRYVQSSGPYNPQNHPSFPPLHPPHHQPVHDQSMMYYHQLNGRLVSCEQLQPEFQKHTKKVDSILPQMWKKIIALEAEVAQLKGQVSTSIDNQETSAPSSKNPLKGLPSTVKSTIRDAVQTQAKALLGVSETREVVEGNSSSRMILILPPPHSAEGVEQRFSDGHMLFNPDWAKTKNDSYNKRYISAVIISVKKQAQVRTNLSLSSYSILNSLIRTRQLHLMKNTILTANIFAMPWNSTS